MLLLNDVEDLLDINIVGDLPCGTLAGLVLQLLGRFPQAEETVELGNYLLTCVEVTPTALVRIKIEKRSENLPAPD